MVAHTQNDIDELIDDPETDYIVHRPDVLTLHDPDALDDLLLHHYDHLQGADAFLDELDSFHDNGRAGPGLMALYKRGRSKGISTIGGVQRPAWVSRSSMAEAQHFYIFNLIDEKDWRRLAELVPGLADAKRPPKHHFYYWRVGQDGPRLMAPIPLDKRFDTGYVDKELLPDSGEGERATAAPKHIWL